VELVKEVMEEFWEVWDMDKGKDIQGWRVVLKCILGRW